MKFSEQCGRLIQALAKTRAQVEFIGRTIGNDDLLFQFQAAIIDAANQLEAIEKSIDHAAKHNAPGDYVDLPVNDNIKRAAELYNIDYEDDCGASEDELGELLYEMEEWEREAARSFANGVRRKFVEKELAYEDVTQQLARVQA